MQKEMDMRNPFSFKDDVCVMASVIERMRVFWFFLDKIPFAFLRRRQPSPVSFVLRKFSRERLEREKKNNGDQRMELQKQRRRDQNGLIYNMPAWYSRTSYVNRTKNPL